MTYDVFGGMLSLAQSIYRGLALNDSSVYTGNPKTAAPMQHVL